MVPLDPKLIPAINQAMDMSVPDGLSLNELRDTLAIHINSLISNNFERLVSLLYRVDVSEPKLKQLLKDNPGTDAAVIIAGLIIERQLQKIESRRKFSSGGDIAEEDKW